MSLTPAAIRTLANKGLSASDIADVAEANVPAQSSSAVRQKRYRDNKRNERNVTRDVTPTPLIEDHNPPCVSSEPIGSSETTPAPRKNGKDEVQPEQVIEAWNLMADQSGVIKAKLTDDRRRKLKTFIRRHTIDDITEAIWSVPRSPFLCGENDRGWKAGIDFLLQPSSFTKLIEGTYDSASH